MSSQENIDGCFLLLIDFGWGFIAFWFLVSVSLITGLKVAIIAIVHREYFVGMDSWRNGSFIELYSSLSMSGSNLLAFGSIL